MSEMRRMRPGLGTFVEITIQSAPRPERAFDEAFGAVDLVQRLMSFHDPESELTRLNTAGGAPMRVHPVMRRVLRLARLMTLRSQGRFNCTLGGLMVARGVLPDHGADALSVGIAEDIVIEQEHVRLARPVLVTLDGIAKGFAVDLAVGALRRSGVKSGCVNAGGDLRVFGATSTPVHRRNGDGQMQFLGHLSDAAIATSESGHAERRRYPGFIIAPEDTRSLVRSGVWTVIAKQAWRADALTKVAAVCEEQNRGRVVCALRGKWAR